MTLHSVKINGQAVQCVDLNAVVIHGRASVTDGPTASSATVTIYDPVMPAWGAGDVLEVFSDYPPEQRFTGTITDMNLVGHNYLGGVFQVDAAGRVADLGIRDVGDFPWPVESPRHRAEKILAAAGLPYRVMDRSSLRVNARDVDRQDALGLITELAQDTGAAVFDEPDGTIVFQHYSTRAETWLFTRWIDLPHDLQWDGWGTGWGELSETWAETEETSPAAPIPLVIDGCAVMWEPGWSSTAGVVANSITTEYGPEVQGGSRPSVTVRNPASVAKFGRRHVTGPKNLADQSSAMERGAMVLSLHSWPQWGIGSVVVLLDKVQSALPFLNLRCGSRVQLVGMPQPAPEHSPVKIVEGWTHTMGAKRDVLELRLSHPAHSYAGIAWQTMEQSVRWLDVAPSAQWVDAITPDDLVLMP